MTETIEIKQQASRADGATQIGIQNNYAGLTVNDAVHLAFQLFHEYYPQLKEEAIADVHSFLIGELERSPQNQIVQPSPKIAVPALQNAAITEEREIRKIYAKLLANSMLETKARQVHPSFVSIVNQLNESDAKLLNLICEIKNNIPVAEIRATSGDQYLLSGFPHFVTSKFDSLDDYWNTSVSLENLWRLNLIEIQNGPVKLYDYNQILEMPFVQARFQTLKEQNPDRADTMELKIVEYSVLQTDFGKSFMKICIKND